MLNMDTSQSGFAGAGLFFLLIGLSGLWLSRSGKPYSTVVLTIHKLIGLAAGVFLVMAVYRAHQAAPLSLVEVTAIVVTALLFATNVATGGLLSTEKTMPAAVSMAHKLLPYATALSTFSTLYILLSRT